MPYFNRCLAILLKPWMIISFIMLLIFSYVYLDRPIAIYFHQLDLKHALPILYWMTHLGISQLYLVILPVLAILSLWFVHNKYVETRLWFLWFCVLTSGAVGLVLKMILGRARPELLFDQQLYGFYGWHTQKAFFSCPSGHATVLTSMMIGLTILFPKYCYAIVLTGLIVILTRVLLTYHYLSDILFSMYLVCLELGLLFYVLRRRYPKTWGLLLK